MADKKSDPIGCIEAGILDNALVIIAVLDKEGKILTWNRAAETITGYSKQETIGSSAVWRLLYPDKTYRTSVTSRIAKILAAKDYFENFETTIRTRSGTSRIILWNTKEIEQEGTSRAIAVGQDITHLRELDSFRESVIDNANVLITVLDLYGKVVMWNTAAEEITGYPRTEAIGRLDIWKRLYPDKEYRDKVTRQIKEVITARQHFTNLETHVTTKTGGKKIISWNTRQIAFGNGQHVISIGIDITEQREAEEALVAYMTEMAMRIKQPVEIIRDNLFDVAGLIRARKITMEESAMLLDGQVRNATQVSKNVLEFQQAILAKNRSIPEAYRKFLEGE
ncbi:MAG: PAS domain S-box protein [Methanoregula sp.]